MSWHSKVSDNLRQEGGRKGQEETPPFPPPSNLRQGLSWRPGLEG